MRLGSHDVRKENLLFFPQVAAEFRIESVVQIMHLAEHIAMVRLVGINTFRTSALRLGNASCM